MHHLRRLVTVMASQDGALANARTAATALARERVVRQEVELFLADRLQRRVGSRTG